jgi:toxin ParE1/3/4
MVRKVKWTRSAKSELEQLLEFIGESAPATAYRLADKIHRAADSLTEDAERGRIVPELEAYFLREIFVNKYRLMYEVKPTEIEIIAIVHMSRDLRNVFPIHQND